MTRGSIAGLIAGLIVTLFGCAGSLDDDAQQSRAATGFSAPGTLDIHVINVGQGNATLLIGPDGTTTLVDGGTAAAGINKVMPYLQGLGLSQLDNVVLTHRHTDHMSGLAELFVRGIDAQKIWDNGSPRGTASVDSFLLAAAATTAGSVSLLPLGTTLSLGGGATATCVAVGGHVISHGVVAGARSENDLSLALLVQHGDFDFIVAGDIGGGDDDVSCVGDRKNSVDLETPLATALTTNATGLLSPDHGVETMIVNHHGSHGATNNTYFNLLSPAVAMIGVGKNGYQHPRKAVVEQVLGNAVTCTSAPAALVLQTDEGDVRASSTDASQAGFAVGDIIISTDGALSFQVSATGKVDGGVDERKAAGLPQTIPMDEPPPNDPASCSNHCGGQAEAGCWCDAACANYGDCCVDKDEACSETIDDQSCAGFCGSKAPGGCWCDASCASYGDCCADKASTCS